MTPSAEQAAPTSIWLLSMLKNAVVDPGGVSLGRLDDVVALLRDDDYPLVTGVLVAGAPAMFVPIEDVLELSLTSVRIASGDRRPFMREPDEVLLKSEILGRRLIDLPRGTLVKAHDIRFEVAPEGWLAVGLDAHRHGWLHFGSHEHPPERDCRDFLPLGGAHGRAGSPLSLRRIGRLKPAQIADIIESAAPEEQGALLTLVHADPELEASVFEEFEEDRQAQFLRPRNDEEIADILSRMRADDAADAIMELPQDRRQNVLDLLPPPHRAKVKILLGYSPATAGGLMGTEYLAVAEDCTVADAIEQLRTLTTLQPEALVTIHSLRPDGTLSGTLSLVRALQLDPDARLLDVTDVDTVIASPDDDIIAVTRRMADFNLLTLPVIDRSGTLVGVVTVDDALEAAIPQDWSRRAPGQTSIVKRGRS